MLRLLITKSRQPSHCLKGRDKAASFCTFPTCHSRRHCSRSRRSASRLTGPEFTVTFGGHYRSGELNDEQAEGAHRLAEIYIRDIHKELSAIPAILREVAALSCVDMFALDDEMLDLANKLALENVAQKPFDHAILAGTLVSSLRLWNKGERGIAFAELDSDLQPWGQKGGPKDDLRKLYDDAHIWVYGDFTLQFPARRADFE